MRRVEVTMERRMTVTSKPAQLSQKRSEGAVDEPARRDAPRPEKSYRDKHVEPQDWRGEGVVGNNHTD
jgi:hypothetical protein